MKTDQVSETLHLELTHAASRLVYALADAAEAASKRGATLTAHHWDKRREMILRLDLKAIAEAAALWMEDHPSTQEG